MNPAASHHAKWIILALVIVAIGYLVWSEGRHYQVVKDFCERKCVYSQTDKVWRLDLTSDVPAGEAAYISESLKESFESNEPCIKYCRYIGRELRNIP